MAQDWLSIIEAIYADMPDDDAWIGGILEAARPTLDEGHGAAGLLYDASSSAGLSVRHFTLRWEPAAMELGRCVDLMQQAPGAMQPVETFGKHTYGLVRATFGQAFPGILERCAQAGVVDMVGVNGVDATLNGCLLVGHVGKIPRLTRHGRAMWTRISAHLAAGYRLRRRSPRRLAVGFDATEAVLEPSGRVQHAEGTAVESDARRTLRDSVRLLEKARGRMRRDEPETAISSWTALVDARWTLLDHFDSDGRRYVVARLNEVPTPSLTALTARERQVVAHVALGHTDKHAGYQLGLAASTVRVLLMRASRKLRVTSRAELSRLYFGSQRPETRPGSRGGAEGRLPRA